MGPRSCPGGSGATARTGRGSSSSRSGSGRAGATQSPPARRRPAAAFSSRTPTQRPKADAGGAWRGSLQAWTRGSAAGATCCSATRCRRCARPGACCRQGADLPSRPGDVGSFHDELTDEQRKAEDREATAAAAPGAILLLMAWKPGRRGPLPRGPPRRWGRSHPDGQAGAAGRHTEGRCEPSASFLASPRRPSSRISSTT